jgi:hypothetical protein
MPARRRKKPAPWTIEKIRAGLIVNKLEKHIFNHPNKREYVANYMDASQVSAALGLLKKVHPDLAATKVDVSGDVTVEVLKVATHTATK